MAKTKSTAIPVSIRRQLASLSHRVSWLEAALKPKKDKAPVDRTWANYLRQSAARHGRSLPAPQPSRAIPTTPPTLAVAHRDADGTRD